MHHHIEGERAQMMETLPTSTKFRFFSQDKLETDVLPMMIVYAVIGVILGLVELITVVLACAYVAQITRKRRREDKGWMMFNTAVILYKRSPLKVISYFVEARVECDLGSVPVPGNTRGSAVGFPQSDIAWNRTGD